MCTIIGVELSGGVQQAQCSGHHYGSPTSIPAKALGAVTVIIYQVEIQGGMFFNQHQAIGTHTESAVADFFNLPFRKRISACAIVYQYKIVAGCLVFMEMYSRHVATIDSGLFHLLVIYVFTAFDMTILFVLCRVCMN